MVVMGSVELKLRQAQRRADVLRVVVGVPTRAAPSGRGPGLGAFTRVRIPIVIDAAARVQPSRARDRACGRTAGVPALCWAALSVGARALARGAPARRSLRYQASASLLPGLPVHACAVSGMDGAAPTRRRGGDRRGARPGRHRAWAPTDRSPTRPAGRDGPRLAACRAVSRRTAARVRNAVASRTGSRARSDRCHRDRAARRAGSGHARGPCVVVAVRTGRRWPVAACRVPHRRAVVRFATAPAVINASATLEPLWLRASGSHRSPRKAQISSHASRTSVTTWASDHRRERSGPNARRVTDPPFLRPPSLQVVRVKRGRRRLTSSFVPHPSMLIVSGARKPILNGAQHRRWWQVMGIDDHATNLRFDS
jgi:hypothetical protein